MHLLLMEVTMYSNQPTKSGSNAMAEELHWVIRIRRSLDEEEITEEDEDGVPPVTIFRVPATWVAGKSECYVPQLIGLGPYHRWQPELHGMEWYKISAARRITKRLRPGLRFQHVVDRFTGLEHRLRASYHGYLDYRGETLAWAMAIDAAFMVEFLHILVAGGGEEALQWEHSKVSRLVGFTRRKCAHNMVLRDLVMLENQIPLWLLLKMLEAQQHGSPAADALLSEMTAELVRQLCPFTVTEDLTCTDVAEGAHLLQLLYNVIVPKPERRRIEETGHQLDEAAAASDGYGFLWKILSCVSQAFASRPVKLLVKIFSHLPVFAALTHSVEHLSGNPKGNVPGVDHESTTPSATELAGAGVRFSPTGGGPAGVAFDAGKATLYLPAVSLDVNTEATLRNLVAYEVSSSSQAPVLARYVEVVGGMVGGEGDVRVLRERGVVRNGMRSDGEAAELWKGTMSRGVQLARVAALDEAVEGVNRYYRSRWGVKARAFLKGRGGWSSSEAATCSCMAVLATMLLLFLMSLHAFCLLTTCSPPKSDAYMRK